MDGFELWVSRIDGWVWGWTLILLIMAVGIYLTLRTGCVQVRHLWRALRYMVKNEAGGTGEVSSFAALCTALSATIGTGNIIGVATAITLGGPGALFWMLVAAFFGMATKYAEGVLAILYRRRTADGRYLGGPFCYIEQGLGSRFGWLASLFAGFGVLAGLLGTGTVTQINGITSALEDFFDPDRSAVAFYVGGRACTWTVVIGGAVVTLLVALVILGGMRRIAAVAQVVVPVMAVLYVLLAVVILLCHADRIPGAMRLLFECAFAPQAALGAAAGITVKQAMQKGIGRGVFSNEAGLGSAPIAAAAAKTKDPVRQGLVSMTGTFIDTILICTMTGLTILVTDAWQQPGLEGVAVTAYAWQVGLPWDSPRFSYFLLLMCLVFFAFTSILGWDYYAERCLEYLTGGRKRPLRLFRWLYIGAVFVGPYLSVSAVWNLADIFNGLMAFPNLVALISLAGTVSKETKAFSDRQNCPLCTLSKKSR